MPTPDGRIGSRDICNAAVVERTIADGGVSSLKISATLQSDNFASGSAGWQINRVTGSCEFQDAVIRGTLNASDITTGTLNAALITVTNLSASSITTGTLNGNLVDVTNINASNITTGSLSADYISGGTISGTTVNVTNLNASNINNGTLSANYLGSGTTGGITINLGNAGKIQSQSGGVLIQGNGYAEFTNVVVSGTINTATLSSGHNLTVDGNLIMRNGVMRTALAGTFIEMGSAPGSNTIKFTTTGIALDGLIYCTATAGGSMYINPPGGGSQILLQSGYVDIQNGLYTPNVWVYGGSKSAPGLSVGNFGGGVYSSSSLTGLVHNGTAIIDGDASNFLYLHGVPYASQSFQLYATEVGAGRRVYYYDTASARRRKNDIVAAADDPQWMLGLTRTDFTYKSDPRKEPKRWYIAEDVYDLAAAAGLDPERYVIRDSEGDIINTDDRAILSDAIAVLADLHDRVAALEAA